MFDLGNIIFIYISRTEIIEIIKTLKNKYYNINKNNQTLLLSSYIFINIFN